MSVLERIRQAKEEKRKQEEAAKAKESKVSSPSSSSMSVLERIRQAKEEKRKEEEAKAKPPTPSSPPPSSSPMSVQERIRRAKEAKAKEEEKKSSTPSSPSSSMSVQERIRRAKEAKAKEEEKKSSTPSSPSSSSMSVQERIRAAKRQENKPVKKLTFMEQHQLKKEAQKFTSAVSREKSSGNISSRIKMLQNTPMMLPGMGRPPKPRVSSFPPSRDETPSSPQLLGDGALQTRRTRRSNTRKRKTVCLPQNFDVLARERDSSVNL